MKASCDETPVKPAQLLSSKYLLAQFWPVIVFAICLVAVWVGRSFAMDQTRANVLLLMVATLSTLGIVGQRLPLQNVLGIAITMTIFSGAILLISAVKRQSFVAPTFNHSFGQLPSWTFPLLWIVAVVNARGVAKLMLNPWQKNKNIGLGLMVLGSVLVATVSRQSFFSQFALAAIGFVVTTPWFIDKKGVQQPPDFQALLIVIGLLLW